MNSPNKRITLKDIADQCGYSVNTVSRALRNDSKLSEATISRIHQIADDLGYMKNVMISKILTIPILFHRLLLNYVSMVIIL